MLLEKLRLSYPAYKKLRKTQTTGNKKKTKIHQKRTFMEIYRHTEQNLFFAFKLLQIYQKTLRKFLFLLSNTETTPRRQFYLIIVI